jgi:hypothetical protein
MGQDSAEVPGSEDVGKTGEKGVKGEIGARR